MREIPRIISVDDHVIEPPHVWQARLPAKFRENGPRVARDAIGTDQLTFETDYPHQDSTWPHTLDAVRSFADRLDDVELEKVLRGNAAHLLGLGATAPARTEGSS